MPPCPGHDAHLAETGSHLRNPRRGCGINIFSQVFPDIFWHFKKYLNDLRIKLSSRPQFNFLAVGFERLCRTVRPIRSHGVKRIRNGENARPERYFLALQTPRITKSVV